jgi:hypothetical protein
LEDAAVTGALLIVVVFVVVLTVGNVLLLFAVIRRLRQLQELVAPPALVPAIGTAVEPFRFDTVDGASVTTDDALAGGPVLVAVLSNTCPACQAMAGEIAALTALSPAPVVLVVADPQHDSSKLLEAFRGMDRVATIGREHPALEALGGITAFPTVLAVRDGKIISSGTRLDKVLPALRERPRVTAR